MEVISDPTDEEFLKENPDEDFEVMLKEQEEEALADAEDYGEIEEQKNVEAAVDGVGGEQEKNKGSNKMRMATALLSPRKRTMTKGGARHGDNIKPLDGRGITIPKSGHSKP
ncbi:unnamed protein product [Eruca vesicaria subsp. sativa]|uniref:Uncharacterized protein n=1 Tax=Eruca vesicaria subsp. sativa TaxID=29727 RepID=A0ABC8J1L8_ERUVS|nr:unnamed protein product [Eruca vesicaria subsp. sativa]